MQLCNILISCDFNYYKDWGINLLKSIRYHNQEVNLHCHIVNPQTFDKLKFVNYTTENRSFHSEDSKISYLQSSRFLQVAKFPKEELFITLDTDTVCLKDFNTSNLISLAKQNCVLQHQKNNKWLAGLVAFSDNNFRYDFAELLLAENIDDWKFGRDQDILRNLDNKYHYTALDPVWMSIGKNKHNSVFLTLKGEQKYTQKYLQNFRRYN